MRQVNVQEVVDTSRGVPAYEENDPSMQEANDMDVVESDDDIKPMTSGFVTKDSGKRVEFETGSVRDTEEGKPRYDLIPTTSLKRLAELYARGAEKYGDNNWKKGQPFSRVYASMYRHMIAWRNGEEDEDHLAAVAWNAFALMHFEELMPELDDLDA